MDISTAKKNIKTTIANDEKRSLKDMYYTTGRAQAIAKSAVFENLTLGVIAINALWIAIETDNNDKENVWQADWGFALAENLFCAFFTFELLVRFAAIEIKWNAFKDAWFVFDSSLVFLMLLETWVAPCIYWIFGVAFKAGGALAILRLVRLCRIARMARLMRAFPELMVLFKGIIIATRSVFFTLMLLLCVVYIFSIGFRQLAIDTPLNTEHGFFNDVPRSMFTLVTMGLYMDGIIDLMAALSAEGFQMLFIYIVFMFICAHTIMNLLIGVLCEVVNVIAVTEKFELLALFVRDRMVFIMENLGVNTAVISKQDFLAVVQDHDAIMTLREIDVDPVNLVDFTEIIFSGDAVSKEGTLKFPDFMEIILSFRGTNNATVKDLVQLRHYLNPQLEKLNARLDSIESLMQHSISPGASTGGFHPGGSSMLATDASSLGAELQGSAQATVPSSSAWKGSWQELRPGIEAVVRQTFEASFEATIDPHMQRMSSSIAGASKKIEEALDRASTTQIGADTMRFVGTNKASQQPHVSAILNCLTELRDSLKQGHAEALSNGAFGDDLAPGVATMLWEDFSDKSRLGLGATGRRADPAPASPQINPAIMVSNVGPPTLSGSMSP